MTIYVMLGKLGRGGVLAIGVDAQTIPIDVPDRSGGSYNLALKNAIEQYIKTNGVNHNQVYHHGSW